MPNELWSIWTYFYPGVAESGFPKESLREDDKALAEGRASAASDILGKISAVYFHLEIVERKHHLRFLHTEQ